MSQAPKHVEKYCTGCRRGGNREQLGSERLSRLPATKVPLLYHQRQTAYLQKAIPREILLPFIPCPFPGLLSLTRQTFHAVPCLDVHVDAMDVAGENQIDIDHDMTKQRLNPDGSPIAEPFTEIVSNPVGQGERNGPVVVKRIIPLPEGVILLESEWSCWIVSGPVG